MKILAFAGSNSDVSINKKLVTYVTTFFTGDDVEILDLNDFEMPIYKHERELESGIPQLAKDFAAKIDGSELIIMSLAEHNSAYSAAFKNIFDWISRIRDRKHFGDKPIFLMGTAPGNGGGKNVIEVFMKRAPFSGANVIETFSLPNFRDRFEEGKGITDEQKLDELKSRVQAVKQFFSN
ncbi:NAD(P)H-dependent oxidoreductase [Marnyiella aurantia]|uniref:NAD(P)H-dependent oxidoreductase n=1 Tax=Marnyiella aurantia TaxID=2758037 RepID=A0A7D7QF60_9FLAO|nr:NAD(P)H-dependent oxidoreductase [Marnyiella aurantia]MBA5246173.1 NAD(P)H-dependent oxidoreductase [Marnyiella aurantia]QMS98443.1 NAD(P)H-dependent oxidoreductase [Marnyiella aurantia]